MTATESALPPKHTPEQDHQDDPLLDIEARLIEQDHRTFSVAWNFLTRERWPKGDSRRSASLKAVIWKLIAPGNVVIGGTALIGLLTVFAMQSQNELITEQLTQNRKNYLEQRQVELFKALYDAKETDAIKSDKSKPHPLNNTRIRQEAFMEYVKRYEDAKQPANQQLNEVITIKPHLRGAFLNGLEIPDMTLNNFDLSSANLANTVFTGGQWDQVNASDIFITELTLKNMKVTNSTIETGNLDEQGHLSLEGVMSKLTTLSSNSIRSLNISKSEFEGLGVFFSNGDTVTLDSSTGKGEMEFGLADEFSVDVISSRFDTLYIHGYNDLPDEQIWERLGLVFLNNSEVDELKAFARVMAIGKSRLVISEEYSDSIFCVGANVEVYIAGQTTERDERRRGCPKKDTYRGFYRLGYDQTRLRIRYDVLAVEVIAEDLINSNESVRIIGYTSDKGEREFNKAMGYRAAGSIKSRLIDLGVPEVNIETISYGEDCAEYLEPEYRNLRYQSFVAIVSETTVNADYFDDVGSQAGCNLLNLNKDITYGAWQNPGYESEGADH